MKAVKFQLYTISATLFINRAVSDIILFKRKTGALISLFRCLISLFYIKPQLQGRNARTKSVVLYLYSTSNHNYLIGRHSGSSVVLYLYSTSNHNSLLV
ncbi:hypothetical protein HMPREF3034_02654 [Prevotella sp. DNF00663]|nr:hypothetical protein HMPREF3034_02654 [Prevotella sp. DNF00663]